jgi:hypothetical protein
MRDSNEQITLLSDVSDEIQNGTIFYHSTNHFPPAESTTELTLRFLFSEISAFLIATFVGYV